MPPSRLATVTSGVVSTDDDCLTDGVAETSGELLRLRLRLLLLLIFLLLLLPLLLLLLLFFLAAAVGSLGCCGRCLIRWCRCCLLGKTLVFELACLMR